MGDKVIKPHRPLTATDIASFLAVPLTGIDCEVNTVASLDNVCTNSLTFSKSRFTDAMVASMRSVCIITKEPPDNTGENAFILVDNPRLAFAKVLAEFFVERKKSGVGQYTVIDPTVKIGKDVVIGNNCTIGCNVVIGDYTEIHNNVVLVDGVHVGKHCRIKSNTVIGEKGFGFPLEKDGTPVELPHLASVRIADYVEIGALNTVVGGALNSTLIHSYVKTDDHVHIAHNCKIGAKTLITACAEISGSVVIGENCWLGPNCSIMNKIQIGNNCFIGLGSVVLDDVSSGAVMAGNPAKLIRMQHAE